MLTVSLDDLFKVTILDSLSACSLADALISIGIAFAIGIMISLVYKKTFSGVLYSKTFSISLIAISMISSMVVFSVTSLAVSLSMLGAMSIIRFRTAVKDPLDIVYVFWAIGSGVVIGAGLPFLSIIGSILISLLLVLCFSHKGSATPYILVLVCQSEKAAEEAMNLISDRVRKYVLKSRSVSGERTEITLEIRLKKNSSRFVNELTKIDQVEKVSLVSYNGEYMS